MGRALDESKMWTIQRKDSGTYLRRISESGDPCYHKPDRWTRNIERAVVFSYAEVRSFLRDMHEENVYRGVQLQRVNILDEKMQKRLRESTDLYLLKVR